MYKEKQEECLFSKYEIIDSHLRIFLDCDHMHILIEYDTSLLSYVSIQISLWLMMTIF